MPVDTSSDLYTADHLCSLAKELAEVGCHYQQQVGEIQLSMYTTQQDDCDEIYVISEHIQTGKKWQIVRVALGKLAEEERHQLNLQIQLHNKAIVNQTA